MIYSEAYEKFKEEQNEIYFKTMESLQYSMGEYEGSSVISEKDFSLLKDLGIAGASLELEDFSCVDFTCFSFGGATYKFSIIHKNFPNKVCNKEIVKQLNKQVKSIDGSYKESHDIRKHPHLLIAKVLRAAKEKYEDIRSYYYLVRLTKDTYFLSTSVSDDEKIEEMRQIHYLEVNPESIVRGGIKTLEPYYEEKSSMEILKDLKIITNASTTLYNNKCISCKTYTHYLTYYTKKQLSNKTYCVQCAINKLDYLKYIAKSWLEASCFSDVYILYLKKGHLFLSTDTNHDKIIIEKCKGSYIGYDKNKAIDKLIWEN